MNKRLDEMIELFAQEDKRLDGVNRYVLEDYLKKIKTLKKENMSLKYENKKLKETVEKLQQKINFSNSRNEIKRIRQTKKYKEFRKQVLKRDDNKCVQCGNTENLQIHHIKSTKDYPDLIMEFNNVQTLCLLCHSKTESYLKK